MRRTVWTLALAPLLAAACSESSNPPLGPGEPFDAKPAFDNIPNNLDASVDAVAEVMTLVAGGSNGTTQLRVVATNGDGKNGCNLTGSTTLVVAVASSNNSVATVSPASVTFASCGDTPTLTITPVAAGSASISLSLTSNDTEGTFDLAPATFTVEVEPAPSTDETGPVITPTVVGTLGNNGWYISDVTVTWSVTDDESAISSSSGCAQTDLDDDTSGTILTCTATSAGGTSSQSVTIKRDATAPIIALASRTPAANSNGWNNGDVTVTWTCTDSGSGAVASPITQTVSMEGANQSATGTCEDNAGNQVSDEHSGISIDTTAPEVACLTPSPSFLLNQSGALVGATVTDQPSGPLAASVSAEANTSTIGSKSVTLTGEDLAGNTNSVSCGYTVGYAFEGLYAPVDRPSTMNITKAGQAVPLKWRLTDANGAAVLDLASVKISVSSVSCSVGTSTDLMEEVASGSSGLQNLGDGYYQFNWKTPTTYANSCKSINLKLGGETERNALAYFQFKK